MQQIYVDEGLVEQLRRILAEGVTYRLFVNDVTPDRETVLGDLTEASFSGYAPIALDDSDFTSEGVVGHIGYMLSTPQAFSNASGSSESAYGFYVTDDSETMLLTAARFDDAPQVRAPTESWLVTPVWGDFSDVAGG